MTLNELIQEVYTITGRPDQVDKTLSAIRAATLKMHQLDFWYKDIFETGISFSSAEYLQQFAYKQLIPLWRSVKYLRKYDAVNQTYGSFLTLVPPAQVVDGSGFSRTDIFYVAGEELDIRSSTAEQYYLLGCYVNPNVTVAGYSSWIAIDHPWAIIYDAAARVFKAIGKDDESAGMRQDVSEQIAMLTADSVQPAGY